MSPLILHTCFLRQYDELNRILGDVEVLAERRSFMPAALRFGEFRIELERHLSDEERVLLPQFVQHGGDSQTVERIVATRTDIVLSVNRVGAALSQSEYAGFCASMTALDRALDAHRHDEETIIHPALEHLLKNDTDWDEMRAKAHFAESPLVGVH